jgi:hypothetical protein
MKGKITIIGVVVALVTGAFAIGWLYFRANPEAWDEFLAEMNSDSASSPSPRPVSRPSRTGSGLQASGSIEAEEITVATR